MAAPEAFPLLVTDSSSLGVRAGILGKDGWMAYRSEEGDTDRKLFSSAQRLLTETGLQLGDLRGFIFCEGPGSTLGIRINCMAVKTWVWLSAGQPAIYAYKSLEAMALLQWVRVGHPYAILSDLRSGQWNGIRVTGPGRFSPVQAVTAQDLEDWPKTRFHLRQRLYSPDPPPGSQLLPYDIEPLGDAKAFDGLIRRVETPSPFETTTTVYKKWEKRGGASASAGIPERSRKFVRHAG